MARGPTKAELQKALDLADEANKILHERIDDLVRERWEIKEQQDKEDHVRRLRRDLHHALGEIEALRSVPNIWTLDDHSLHAIQVLTDEVRKLTAHLINQGHLDVVLAPDQQVQAHIDRAFREMAKAQVRDGKPDPKAGK